MRERPRAQAGDVGDTDTDSLYSYCVACTTSSVTTWATDDSTDTLLRMAEVKMGARVRQLAQVFIDGEQQVAQRRKLSALVRSSELVEIRFSKRDDGTSHQSLFPRRRRRFGIARELLHVFRQGLQLKRQRARVCRVGQEQVEDRQAAEVSQSSAGDRSWRCRRSPGGWSISLMSKMDYHPFCA